MVQNHVQKCGWSLAEAEWVVLPEGFCIDISSSPLVLIGVCRTGHALSPCFDFWASRVVPPFKVPPVEWVKGAPCAVTIKDYFDSRRSRA